MAEDTLTRRSEITYVALDPGETTGFATFTAQGELIEYGQFPMKELVQYGTDLISNTPNLKAVIIENYKNHAWTKQRNWSVNQTSKNIGKFEILADIRNIPYHLQPNTVKAIGYMWARLGEPPKNHSISHQFDAVAHGTYWLVTNKIKSPISIVKGSTNE